MLARELIVLAAMVPSFFATPELPAAVLCEDTPGAKEGEPQEAKDMTKEEAAFLRTAIYDQGISTYIRTTDTALPHREVSLKTAIVELHKKKRVATLKLLLEIARGAAPRDALAASVTALALEEGPVYALGAWDQTSDSFDKVKSNDEPTKRERLVGKLEKVLVPGFARDSV